MYFVVTALSLSGTVLQHQGMDGGQAGVNLFSKIKTVAYYSIVIYFMMTQNCSGGSRGDAL
jgi:hypothetical protein